MHVNHSSPIMTDDHLTEQFSAFVNHLIQLVKITIS